MYLHWVTTQHTWEKHEVDGGPLGVAAFWRCTDCGAAGGPVTGDKPRWAPFLAGAGADVKLSSDCWQASYQVMDHVLQVATQLEEKFSAHTCQYHYAGLFREAIRLNGGRNFTLLYEKARQQSFNPETLAKLREELVEAGFKLDDQPKELVECPACTNASLGPIEKQISLATLREASGKSLKDIASLLGMTQKQVLRFERKLPKKLRQMHRLIAAMGGSLDVTVTLNEKVYWLAGDSAGSVSDVMP